MNFTQEAIYLGAISDAVDPECFDIFWKAFCNPRVEKCFSMVF